MKIKWLASVSGLTYGDPKGKTRGQVDDLPEAEAQRMINCGMAQANWRDAPGPPFVMNGPRKRLDGWTK